MTLIDSSVWGWRHRSEAVATVVDRWARTNLAATCHPVMLELLYGARNADAFRIIRAGLEAQSSSLSGAGSGKGRSTSTSGSPSTAAPTSGR